MSAAREPDRGPDDPQVRHRSPPAADRARSAAGRVGSTWRELNQPQRLAGAAAIALLLSMLLPWYQETGFAVVDGRPVSLDDSKNAFQVYSFIEAAIFVVAAGVLALLWARGQRKAFHLPGGDGTVLLAGGLWVMLLIFYRQLDKPDGRREGPISTSVGVEWGIFIAFLLGALLAYAGYRLRAAHNPEPPVDNAPAAPSDVGPGPPPAAPPSPSEPPPRADPTPGAEPTPGTEPAPRAADPNEAPTEHAGPPAEPAGPPAEPAGPPAERTEPRDEIADEQLSFDEPAEYRPPPRRG